MSILYVDPVSGSDIGTTTPFGWWSVAYTNATGTRPLASEIVTGDTSSSTAKLTISADATEWAAGSGTLYFFAKSAAFVAETVSCAGGGDFDIAADFIVSAWKTFSSAPTFVTAGDTMRIKKSPAPTSMEQDAQWTTITTKGGTPYIVAKSIASSTGAGGIPIVITIVGHPFSNGDVVQVYAHTVNTTANGNWIIQNVTPDTFELTGSVGTATGGATGTVTQANHRCVVLTTAVTKEVHNCDTIWTSGGSGATPSVNTAARKEGAGCANISITSTWTTGKFAYKTIPSTDFSAYQQINFWVRHTNINANNKGLALRLCSDTAGATVVKSVPIPNNGSASVWTQVVFDNGSPLGAAANAIQSVSLSNTVDFGTTTLAILVDNIFCSLPPTDHDSLTLGSLISKDSDDKDGTDGWYGLQSISGHGTTNQGKLLFIDDHTNTLGNAGRGYFGDTELVNLYKREAYKVPSGYNWSVSGTAGNEIQFQGGYNPVTNLQDGETFFDGLGNWAYGAWFPSSHIIHNYINYYRYYTAGLATEGNTNFAIPNMRVSGGNAGWYAYGPTTGSLNSTIGNVYAHNNSTGIQLYANSGGSTFANLICRNNVGLGLDLDSSQNNTFTLLAVDNSAIGMRTAYNNTLTGKPTRNTFTTTTANYCGTGLNPAYGYDMTFTTATANYCNIGATITAATRIMFDTLTTSNGIQYGLYFNTTNNCLIKTFTSDSNQYAVAYNLSYGNRIMKGSSTGNSIATSLILSNSLNYLNRFSMAEATEFVGATDGSVYSIYSGQHDDTNTNHYVFTESGTIQTDPVNVHTAGIAWRMDLTSTARTVTYPMVLPIARVTCTANKLVTVKAYMKKSHATDIGAKLVCRGLQISDVETDATATKANDTNWQELTITFTPDVTGTVEIEAWAYWVANLADETVFVDDMTITIADSPAVDLLTMDYGFQGVPVVQTPCTGGTYTYTEHSNTFIE